MSNITDKPWLVPGHMYQYDIGWLVEKILSFETELSTAIDLKTIHYADPIQWDITTQYAPNTVVVDPKTGTAYMSKTAVPAGILLSNTDYWVVIFNYQRIYDKIMSGVAFNDKDNLNASKDLLVNDLVWYGGDLYRCTRAIPEGTTYIPGTNLTPTTIADCLATYYGRDRVAQVLNDTVNVSGDYTLNAGDIAVTCDNNTHKSKSLSIDSDSIDINHSSITIGNNMDINIDVDLNTPQPLNYRLPQDYNRYFKSIPFRHDDDIYQVMVGIDEPLSQVVNVLDYGVINDGLTDNYNALFDLMHNLDNLKSRVIYFPTGKYIISDTIFIPSNTTLIGEGASTEIYYNGSHGYYGTGFRPAGDYITIRNMLLNHKETSDKILQQSMLGAIGISDSDFNDWTDKHQERPVSTINHHDITICTVFSDSNYIVQCETNNKTIYNVNYSNIIAPRAKVSFLSTNTGRVDNVKMTDILCSVCGQFGGNNNYTFYNRIHTSNLHLGSGNAFVSNSIIDAATNYNLNDFWTEACYLGSGITKFNNVSFINTNSYYKYYTLLGDNTVFFNNVTFDDNNLECIHDANPTNGVLYASNCDFHGASVPSQKGYAVNSNGTFSTALTFIDKTKYPDIKSSAWTADAPNVSTNVCEAISLTPGTYVILVSVPTSSSTSGTLKLSGINDWFCMATTNNKAVLLHNFNAPTKLAITANSTGMTFTNLSNGYLKVIKLT